MTAENRHLALVSVSRPGPSTGDPTSLSIRRFVLKELTALLLGIGERLLTLGMKALRLVLAHHLAVAARAFTVTEYEVLRFVTRPSPNCMSDAICWSRLDVM
jgi:hypothetical protein